MLGQTNSDENVPGINVGNVVPGSAGIEPNQQGRQSLDDVGIGIGAKPEMIAFGRINDQPDTAGAAFDPALVGLFSLRQGRHGLSQIDQISVTLFPIAKEFKFLDQIINIGFGIRAHARRI